MSRFVKISLAVVLAAVPVAYVLAVTSVPAWAPVPVTLLPAIAGGGFSYFQNNNNTDCVLYNVKVCSDFECDFYTDPPEVYHYLCRGEVGPGKEDVYGSAYPTCLKTGPGGGQYGNATPPTSLVCYRQYDCLTDANGDPQPCWVPDRDHPDYAVCTNGKEMEPTVRSTSTCDGVPTEE